MKMLGRVVLVTAFAMSCLGVGCAEPGHETDRDPSTAPELQLGRISMPLVIEAGGGRKYRLTGSLGASYRTPDGGGRGLGFLLDSQQSSWFSATLRPGTYEFRLAGFRMYLVGAQGEVDVTTRTRLVSPEIVTGTVVANANLNIGFHFEVDGVVVPFDPCTVPNSLACSSHDNDGDGLSNGVECGTPQTACIDTDGDGHVDAEDTDSDNDLYPDGTQHESEPRDACVPNVYASECTNPGSGHVTVDIGVHEQCAATGQDTCTFEPAEGPNTMLLGPSIPYPWPEDGNVNPQLIQLTSPSAAGDIQGIDVMTGSHVFVASYAGPALPGQSIMVTVIPQASDWTMSIYDLGYPDNDPFRLAGTNSVPGEPAVPVDFRLRVNAPADFRAVDYLKIIVEDGMGNVLAREWITVGVNPRLPN